MKVATYQCLSVLDKDKNISRAKEIITKASKNNCDLVVFPELFLTGYSSNDYIKNSAFTLKDNSILTLQKLCKESNIACVVGFAKTEKKKVFNSACFIDKNGKIAGVYDKTHLWGGEKSVFEPGDELNVIETSMGKVGLLICYDIEFPEPARILASKGADFICCISANMKPYDDVHKTFIKARALENMVPVIYCNYVGDDGNFVYVGQSNVIDSDGKDVSRFSKKVELKFAQINIHKEKTDISNYFSDIRNDLYQLKY